MTPPRFDQIQVHPDDAVTAYTYFEAKPELLEELADDLFRHNWSRIVVGPCVEGAVFEVCFAEAPAVRLSDGYLTVDLGKWHFHLCIGPHRGSPSEELRRMRPVAKVAFFERRGKGCAGGRSWGLRMWNGYGEQMLTVFLPNPRLNGDMQMLKEPNWSRLELYYSLREKYLGEPCPADFEIAASLPLPEPVT